MSCAKGCCESPREHYQSLVVAKGDTSPEVLDIRTRDAQLDRDRSAYKRLRDDGVQPNQVDGSAHLEQSAVEQIDIDFKVPIPKENRDQVKEIVAEAAMNNYSGQPA